MDYLMTISIVAAILEDNNIPFTMDELCDRCGYKITFDWTEGDVVCNSAVPQETVESMGFPWDEDDVTQLSPEYMGARIVGYFVHCTGQSTAWWIEEEEF